ncbi:MAG: hypothetical protein Q7S60_06005, partial [bacterium]|nr:hypothetical protein [bacterium]
MLSLKKMLKNFLIIGILISVFFGAGFSLAVAFNLISPQGSNVPPNSYFQWQSAGVDIYGVNLRTPGQSWVEHKIKASESNFCNPQNCSFPFLDQGIASEINYGGTYTWKVIAYDT